MNDASTSKPERVLIIALTYGEPEKARIWEQYRYSLLILKRLTRKIAEIPKSLLPLIALFRGFKRVKQWRKEKYRSPLEKISREQVSSLLSILQDRDPSRHYEIRLVLEFRPPLLPEVLTEIEKDPPDRIYFLPLYIVDSDFTTGISEEDFQEYLQQSAQSPLPRPEYISAFTEDARMIDLIDLFLDEQLDNAGWSERTLKEAVLILGAHGTPIYEPEGMNTGYQAMQCFYQQLEDRLSPRFARISIGWMNHVRGGEWTSPDLYSAINDVQKQGINRLVYYPFGFLADNSETQLEGRMELKKFPRLDILHLPCFNTWPPFLHYLADRILLK